MNKLSTLNVNFRSILTDSAPRPQQHSQQCLWFSTKDSVSHHMVDQQHQPSVGLGLICDKWHHPHTPLPFSITSRQFCTLMLFRTWIPHWRIDEVLSIHLCILVFQACEATLLWLECSEITVFHLSTDTFLTLYLLVFLLGFSPRGSTVFLWASHPMIW